MIERWLQNLEKSLLPLDNIQIGSHSGLSQIVGVLEERLSTLVITREMSDGHPPIQ